MRWGKEKELFLLFLIALFRAAFCRVLAALCRVLSLIVVRNLLNGVITGVEKLDDKQIRRRYLKGN